MYGPLIKILKQGDLNEVAYEDLNLLINTSSFVGKVAFGLGKNAKSADFPKGNFNIAWDKLVRKYALHTALPLLKLNSEFHNSKLESMEKGPDELISTLKWLQIQMNDFG